MKCCRYFFVRHSLFTAVLLSSVSKGSELSLCLFSMWWEVLNQFSIHEYGKVIRLNVRMRIWLHPKPARHDDCFKHLVQTCSEMLNLLFERGMHHWCIELKPHTRQRANGLVGWLIRWVQSNLLHSRLAAIFSCTVLNIWNMRGPRNIQMLWINWAFSSAIRRECLVCLRWLAILCSYTWAGPSTFLLAMMLKTFSFKMIFVRTGFITSQSEFTCARG